MAKYQLAAFGVVLWVFFLRNGARGKYFSIAARARSFELGIYRTQSRASELQVCVGEIDRWRKLREAQPAWVPGLSASLGLSHAYKENLLNDAAFAQEDA
jgi:hypothetical protein